MRSVVREKQFDESLALLFRDEEFADLVANSVEWALARCLEPQAYPLVRQTVRGSVMAYMSRRQNALPPFVVLFTYEEGTIFLLDIWASVPDE